MQAQDWTDALFAFQAAFDARAKCPPKLTSGIWGYWTNVEMAAAYYNLRQYKNALQVLSAADTWFSSVDLSHATQADKNYYQSAKTTADLIRSNIAAWASRPQPAPVVHSAPYGSSLGAPPAAAIEERAGTVVVTRPSCDYFIVDAAGGYALLEWFGGWTPDRGDDVAGTFETYGIHTLYDRTAEQSTRVWVEDYWLSSDEAYEKLNEHCQ